MKNTAAQITLLLLVLAFCVMTVVVVRQVLLLPFGPTNDDLHQKNAAFTLDSFIPAGTYIDRTMTIQDIIKIRLQQETPFFRSALQSFSDVIPLEYRLFLNCLLFAFLSFQWMIVFRIFTFMGYGRALRASLLMGGILYCFLPDFSPGKMDDAVFLCIAVLIILIRVLYSRKSRQIMRI